MTTEKVAIDSEGLRKDSRKGIIGAVWLTILTIIEFIVYTAGEAQTWRFYGLLPFVALKGWIILDTFMHVRALWSDDH